MSNKFDRIVKIQNKIRSISSEFEFWIKSQLLTENELVNILRWYLEPSQLNIVDEKGLIRKAIVKQLPDEIVFKHFDIKKNKKNPHALFHHLRARFEKNPWIDEPDEEEEEF